MSSAAKAKPTFGRPGGPRRTVQWKAGAVIGPPLNTWRQHRNRGAAPARLLAISNAPVVIDLFHNLDFVFNNDYVFRDRYQRRSGRLWGRSRTHSSQGHQPCRERAEGRRGHLGKRLHSGRAVARPVQERASAARRIRGSNFNWPTTRCRPTSPSSRWALTRRRTGTVPDRMW